MFTRMSLCRNRKITGKRDLVEKAHLRDWPRMVAISLACCLLPSCWAEILKEAVYKDMQQQELTQRKCGREGVQGWGVKFQQSRTASTG